MQHERTYKRLLASLKQLARTESVMHDPQEVCEKVLSITEKCGSASQGRQALYRIGKTLLTSTIPSIVVPICPDYTHEQGKYTFKGLNGSVPLLAHMHIAFLRDVQSVAGDMDVHFLIADQEANDPYLRSAVQKSQEEFSSLVFSSYRATQREVDSLGWNAHLMSTFVADITEREQITHERIKNAPEHRVRIQTDTHMRSDIYRKISSIISTEEMIERTIRTAAQYVALGEFAQERNLLICNHTTVNLGWYQESSVGVLHNPISVY